MIDEHIVEGLRQALATGQDLEQAMMSFWNAGYKKEDIEESARYLAKHPDQPLSHIEKEIPEHMKKPVAKTLPTSMIKPKPEEKEKSEELKEEKQKISKYEEKTKPKGRVVTILLIVFLIILLCALAGIFIFREQLVEFFSRFA